MALANDMTLLVNKLAKRLKVLPLLPYLPDYLNKDAWVEHIKTDTMVTFSRYYPNTFKMIINEETCNKKMEENVMWYYIKDEILQGCKLLGVEDIDWTDTSAANSSLTNGSTGNYYYPGTPVCIEGTLDSILGLQMMADFASLYNRGITIDFKYPNKFCLKGLGNTNYDLSSFVVKLLVEHVSLNTISPTMMEIFEALAASDVAGLLLNLKYVDGIETAYLNIDLKLSELEQIADKRDSIIDTIKEAYVSTSNDAIPYIWTV